MAELLKGASVAARINDDVALRVLALKKKGITPTLAIVRVGEKPDDIAYENGAKKRCEKLEIAVKQYLYPDTVTQKELTEAVECINRDETVHGCLLLRPLPKHIDDAAVRNALCPEKDVDGVSDISLAGVFSGGGRGFAPCTAAACMEILDCCGCELSGKRAVVVGRSLVVGRPVAMLLLAKNATVTVCHTKTRDIESVCRGAELLVVAAGRAGVVGAAHVSAGQTVLDVGINVNENNELCGDVDFGAVEPLVKAITPVPGGVGTVTTSVLAKHVVEAAERTCK